MSLRLLALGLALAAALASPRALAKGKDKDRPPPLDPPKTGVTDLMGSSGKIRMGVPKDYDAKRFYPLFFVLHPGSEPAPDPWIDAWSEELPKKGWIVAGPHTIGDYGNESSVEPLKTALAKVKDVYRIDDRRVVIGGHATGANMAWQMATVAPNLFAGVVAWNGGVPPGIFAQVRQRLAGKPAFLFTGAKDTYYRPEQAEKDRKELEFAKLAVTLEVRPDWANDFSKATVPKVAEWLAGVWPPGAYREKAAALEAAIAKKDFAAAQAAAKELRADLKKNPYFAFEARAKELEDALLAAGRALVEDAKAQVAANKPLLALERAEAAAKALKGLKPVDAEAAAALAALRKDPAVVGALAQKKAEESVSTYMERAAAAEAKGDLAKALDWYRKAAALGETSRKAEADAKVAELEPKVGAGMETR
jgi:dienelactone hydrolase